MTRASDIAYKTIRSLILDGSYAPGQRMIEEELAQRVGVSRTSVRDSLRRLASDGLVHTEPSRGTFVANLSATEIDEIFQLRSMLEGHATALAALNAQPQDLDELESITADIEDLLRRADLAPGELFSRFQASNSSFHGIILRASGSLRLQALAKPLIELPLVLMKNHNWPGEVSVHRSNQQHMEIIEALRARDPLLGKIRIQSHIISTRPRAMVEKSLLPLNLLS
jgi:DNA-binding GntR family transcriptional regulator